MKRIRRSLFMMIKKKTRARRAAAGSWLQVALINLLPLQCLSARLDGGYCENLPF